VPVPATTPHAAFRAALTARPPPLDFPGAPVPASVVSQSLPRPICRTVVSAPMYTWPPPDATPHGPTASRVARPGPPTLPATVEITPAAPG
jgi:hypothetical protein